MKVLARLHDPEASVQPKTFHLRRVRFVSPERGGGCLDSIYLRISCTFKHVFVMLEEGEAQVQGRKHLTCENADLLIRNVSDPHKEPLFGRIQPQEP